MKPSGLSIVFAVATIYFAVQLVPVILAGFRLLAALRAGRVTWPGPRIHDPDPSASVVRERLGAGYENLFPTFLTNALGGMGAFVFFLLAFLASTSLLSGYVQVKSGCILYFLTIFGFVGGRWAALKAKSNAIQVTIMLSDLGRGVEPRAVDARSAEAEYAIEHPLLHSPDVPPDLEQALNLFYESTRCHQDGKERRALTLYQEALKINPTLHQDAVEALSNMAHGGSLAQQGAVTYWLGIHSEYLMNRVQAAAWYEKAIHAFAQIGYQKRESRAHCNLGNVKMQLRDQSGMEEFEKAIALNPRNGTAHLNIARTYYLISGPGDPQHELALDSFANAIVADPLTYGPRVISSLRQLGYTWKEDLEEITRRVEDKRRQATGDS